MPWCRWQTSLFSKLGTWNQLGLVWSWFLAEIYDVVLTGRIYSNSELLSLLQFLFYPKSLLSSPMSTSYSTKQWAAVMTQHGEMMAPPHTCLPLQCRLTCQPHLPLAAIAPPTIRRPSLTRTVQSACERDKWEKDRLQTIRELLG